MWHLSVGSKGMKLGSYTLEAEARRVLDGYGDATLGEWVEPPARGVLHLRRRLSVQEAEPIGPVVDIRGTDEAERRLSPVRHLLPEGWDS